MKKRIFITATNTNIGKTYTTKLLLREFAKKSLRVGALKPIESGVKDGLAQDALELLTLVKELNSELSDFELKDITPYMFSLPAAPFVAGKGVDVEIIKDALMKLEKHCDIVFIEGAGGLYVPIEKDYFMIDLIKDLKAKALLVTHCSLGCINDTLLSQKALQAKDIEHIVAFNCKDELDFKTISKPYFDEVGFDILEVKKDIVNICEILYN